MPVCESLHQCEWGFLCVYVCYSGVAKESRVKGRGMSKILSMRVKEDEEVCLLLLD